MAGTNQAVNLSGMLSQIGSTLGAPIDISGLTRSIQGMSRPNADPSNLEEMQRLMNWQQKVGRTDEAKLSALTVSDLQEQQTANAVAKADGEFVQKLMAARQKASAAAASGDPVLKRQAAEELARLKPTTSQQSSAYSSVMSDVAKLEPKFKEADKANKIQQVFSAQRALSDGKIPGQAKAGVEQFIAQATQDPEVLQGVNAAIDSQLDTEAKQRTAEEAQKIDTARAAVLAAWGNGGEEAYARAAKVAGNYGSYGADVLSSLETVHKANKQVAALKAGEGSFDDVANSIDSIINTLEEGEQEQFRTRLKAAKTKANETGKGGAASDDLNKLLVDVGKIKSNRITNELKEDARVKADENALVQRINLSPVSDTERFGMQQLSKNAKTTWTGEAIDLTTAGDLVRDERRFNQGLPTKYKFSPDGRPEFDENGQPKLMTDKNTKNGNEGRKRGSTSKSNSTQTSTPKKVDGQKHPTVPGVVWSASQNKWVTASN